MTKKMKLNDSPDLMTLARLEIEHIYNNSEDVQDCIAEYLNFAGCSIPMEELHLHFCLNEADILELDIHQFYSLYIYPLLMKKRIRIANFKECTKDKPLPMTEYELKYVKPNEKISDKIDRGFTGIKYDS